MASMHPNKIALLAAKAVLEAAQPFDFELEGTAFLVAPEARPDRTWPKLSGDRSIEGIDEAADGPWPAAVILKGSWRDGTANLELRLNIWRPRGPTRVTWHCRSSPSLATVRSSGST
jgi:hypothetical protein